MKNGELSLMMHYHQTQHYSILEFGEGQRLDQTLKPFECLGLYLGSTHHKFPLPDHLSVTTFEVRGSVHPHQLRKRLLHRLSYHRTNCQSSLPIMSMNNQCLRSKHLMHSQLSYSLFHHQHNRRQIVRIHLLHTRSMILKYSKHPEEQHMKMNHMRCYRPAKYHHQHYNLIHKSQRMSYQHSKHQLALGLHKTDN